MPKRSQSIKTSDQKGGKPWLRQRKPYAYSVNSREKNRTFLVFCEGQTEEQYFNSFPVLSAVIKCFHQGSTKTALVNAVKQHKRNGIYDEIWCVFDFDSNPMITGQNDDFNTAIQKARELNYHCAYSNDAFELWFALHYQFLDQEQPRSFYFQLLSNRWNINYQNQGKSLHFSRTIYVRLLEDQNASQNNAIKHARRLLDIHGSKPYHLQNPVTTVFQLVERLNEHCRK